MAAEKKNAVQPALEPLDQRVPREVWECIFNGLYPSQLSRLSLVNKNFNDIVSSLSLWSRMFTTAHGPKTRLRCLRGMPESKSYMLYMCANSLRVCEQCLGSFNHYFAKEKLEWHLAPLPTLCTEEFKYLGEPINEDWKIFICLSCSRKNRGTWAGYDTNYFDKTTKSRVQWYRSQQ